MKTLRTPFLAGMAILLASCITANKQTKSASNVDSRARVLRLYAEKRGYSTRYCFLLDMRIHSGRKRFFVYDLSKNAIILSGLVAHGSGTDESFFKEASFSNQPGTLCTSAGVYKVGKPYYGNYGRAYRLHGLQQSNSNAFKRAIVLHSYNCVPNEEIYPRNICSSAGCPMVSASLLKTLSRIIDRSDKPMLLWIYK